MLRHTQHLPYGSTASLWSKFQNRDVKLGLTLHRGKSRLSELEATRWSITAVDIQYHLLQVTFKARSDSSLSTKKKKKSLIQNRFNLREGIKSPANKPVHMHGFYRTFLYDIVSGGSNITLHSQCTHSNLHMILCWVHTQSLKQTNLPFNIVDSRTYSKTCCFSSTLRRLSSHNKMWINL